MSGLTPEIRAPDLSDLKSVATKHNLNIPDEELTLYKDFIASTFEAVYREVESFPDQCLPVKYRSSRDRVPGPEENPYNAWVRLTDTFGSGKGKLAGRTVAIKDNVSMAGLPLSNGSDFMRGFQTEFNATIVDRILDAGATIRGRANCENLCFSGHSFSSVTGPVLNPHDKTRSAGGSSSGSAVLVAAEEVDMAIGTDQGGSIRLPSCWCGVVGLKPTYGLVPYTGIHSLSGCLDFAGPIARTVSDCALLLEIIAGNDGLDPRQPVNIQPKNYTAEINKDINGLRIGVLLNGFDGAESDVAELVKAAAHSLEKVGADVIEFSSDIHRKAGVFAFPLVSEGTYTTFCSYGIDQTRGYKDVRYQDFLHDAMQTKTNDLPIGLKALFLREGYIKERYGHHFYAKAANAIRGIVTEYDELFKHYDVIIMPTIKYKAPKFSATGKLQTKEFLDEHIRMIENTVPYNATGHPAININVGYSEGLPVGMMIVGRHWEDELVLRVARAAELQTSKNND